jgi:hypothetical protein
LQRHPIKLLLKPDLKIDITRLQHAMGIIEAAKRQLLGPGQEVVVDQSPLDIGDQVWHVVSILPDAGMIQVQGGKSLLNISLGRSFDGRTRYQETVEQVKQKALSFWKKGGEYLSSMTPTLDFSAAGQSMLTLVAKGQVPKSRMEAGAMGFVCLAQSIRLDFKTTDNYCQKDIDPELDLPLESTAASNTSEVPVSEARDWQNGLNACVSVVEYVCQYSLRLVLKMLEGRLAKKSEDWKSCAGFRQGSDRECNLWHGSVGGRKHLS